MKTKLKTLMAGLMALITSIPFAGAQSGGNQYVLQMLNEGLTQEIVIPPPSPNPRNESAVTVKLNAWTTWTDANGVEHIVSNNFKTPVGGPHAFKIHTYVTAMDLEATWSMLIGNTVDPPNFAEKVYAVWMGYQGSTPTVFMDPNDDFNDSFYINPAKYWEQCYLSVYWTPPSLTLQGALVAGQVSEPIYKALLWDFSPVLVDSPPPPVEE